MSVIKNEAGPAIDLSVGIMWRLLFVAFLLPGCAQRIAAKVLIEGVPPRIHDRMEGSTQVPPHPIWYDAEQLDQIVREYVRKKKVAFDFRGTEPQFWVPRDRQILATATYTSGFGRPILFAKIDRDGHVVGHNVAIAVEGPIGSPSESLTFPTNGGQAGDTGR